MISLKSTPSAVQTFTRTSILTYSFLESFEIDDGLIPAVACKSFLSVGFGATPQGLKGVKGNPPCKLQSVAYGYHFAKLA
jgi:hypothetical protein